MRDEVNAVLAEIGQSNLTDEEFHIMLCKDLSTDALVFKALSDTINSRGAEGNAIEKLEAAATLRGIEILFTKKVNNNIFIGAPL